MMRYFYDEREFKNKIHQNKWYFVKNLRLWRFSLK